MSIVESTVKKFNPDIFVICSAESNGFDPKLTRELIKYNDKLIHEKKQIHSDYSSL